MPVRQLVLCFCHYALVLRALTSALRDLIVYVSDNQIFESWGAWGAQNGGGRIFTRFFILREVSRNGTLALYEGQLYRQKPSLGYALRVCQISCFYKNIWQSSSTKAHSYLLFGVISVFRGFRVPALGIPLPIPAVLFLIIVSCN